MRKHWKLILVITVVLLVGLATRISTLGDKPEKEVEAYKKSLIAKGERLEISELLPPAVPTEQNGADIVKAASSMLIYGGADWSNIPPAMLMIEPGKAIIGFEQPMVREQYFFTNSWANVMAAAEANRPAIELLKQLLNYPALDFHIDYSKGWEADVPALESQLRSLGYCAERLSGDAVCDLRKGDAASATTNICTILALVNGEQDERLADSNERRMSMEILAARANWELLQSTNVNDAELALLQRNWERLEFIHAFENFFVMNRACCELVLRKMRASQEYFNKEMADNDDWNFSGDWSDKLHNLRDSTKNTYGKAMWRASWTYSDELRMLQYDQSVLKTIRTIETNHFYNPAYSDMMKQLETSESAEEKDDYYFFRWGFSNNSVGWASFLGRTMALEAGRQIVVTAIALKRYELKHGVYPPDLNSLAPEFVSTVPMDPVDGKPLRYRLNADGTFLLYSIGSNGKDDGGDPSDSRPGRYHYWLYPAALDWVWPQPATSAEIEYYYEHPPK